MPNTLPAPQYVETLLGEDRAFRVTMQPATNIAGWSLAFRVKRQGTDDTVLIEKTTANLGVNVVDPANGVFDVLILKADTTDAAVGAGSYEWNLFRTDSGNEILLARGYWSIPPRVGT